MSLRGTEQIGVFVLHTCDESFKWEMNDRDAQDFQKLTVILKIFEVVKLQ